MTLTDLLLASQNQIYRQTHKYNLNKNLVEKFLSSVKEVEVKSKAYIRVRCSSSSDAAVDIPVCEVVESGIWTCSIQGEWMTFLNFATNHQVEMAKKKQNGMFVVQQTFHFRKTLKFEYMKELSRLSKQICEDFHSRYEETEGHIRAREVLYLVNDYLRQQTSSSENTRLVKKQSHSTVLFIGLLDEYNEAGSLSVFYDYLKTRGKPYGKYKNR